MLSFLKTLSFNKFFLFVAVLPFLGCKSTDITTSTQPEAVVEVVFVHFNDVYEIAPLAGGAVGGLSRVGTVIKQQKALNPNTVAVLAGDFLSPSFIGNIEYEGERIAGRQMIEAMNAAGFDLVTFGNHEFDVKHGELRQRIANSNFQWISSNVKQRKGQQAVPFYQRVRGVDRALPETYILNVSNEEGDSVTIGLFAVTLPMNQKEYVVYEDIHASAKAAIEDLQPRVDVLVALTHLNMVDDRNVAGQFPELGLIMGGHDHEAMYEVVNGVPIAKADANAKTAYIHTIRFYPEIDSVAVDSELIPLAEEVEPDLETKKVVDHWMRVAEEHVQQENFQLHNTVYIAEEPLDGLEAHVRNHPTNLTRIIADAIHYAAREKATAAIVNAGSIRIDDLLQGEITEYDILRTLPFGGGIEIIEVDGAFLKKILNAGLENQGSGGYLHHSNIYHDSRTVTWYINEEEIRENEKYVVAITDFLLTGGERNMAFLTKDNTEVKVLSYNPSEGMEAIEDVRKAVIRYLMEGYH